MVWVYAGRTSVVLIPGVLYLLVDQLASWPYPTIEGASKTHREFSSKRRD